MPAVRLKRAAVYALGAGALVGGCSIGTAYPAYGGAAVPCPDGGYACYDYVPPEAGPDVAVGDAFMGGDAATADGPVEAAPDVPSGVDAGGD
jgi:hypothetical protein